MPAGLPRILLSFVLCCFGCVAAGGCTTADADDTPADALTHFLEAMDRSAQDDAALADAYALLDAADRRALADRAAQAATVAGRDFEPWEMLAQGRYRRRFVPAEHGGMRTELHGTTALVRVTGADGHSLAEVPLVKQSGHWRVQLRVPKIDRYRERTKP